MTQSITEINPDTRSRLRIALIVSTYSGEITGALERGAIEEFKARCSDDSCLTNLPAPGAFELPVIASAAATSGRFDAVVCLGCVARGETSHDRYIAGAVAQSLARIGETTGVPVTFGVLTVENRAQAEARSGGANGNKGREAMSAAIEAAAVIRALRESDGGR